MTGSKAGLSKSAVPWTALLLAALAGCGGGGGGGGSSASSSEPSPPPAVTASVAWQQRALQFQRDVFDTRLPAAATASLVIRNAGSYWYGFAYNKERYIVSTQFRTADEGIDFTFQPLGTPPAIGAYDDTLQVRLCEDQACTREFQGSPFRLPTRVEVGYFAEAEAGITPLAPTQTTTLGHDVVGAAYSAALDAVILLSAQPDPVLVIHDLQTGAMRRVALTTRPTALSVAADGLRAAVGHDAAVSIVDLRADPATAVRRFSVPVSVGAVVLAGSRVVLMGDQPFNWNPVYWLDTTSGVATRATNSLVYGVGQSALHPAGDRVYLADRGLSPDDVRRMDLGEDVATVQLRDSRYHGDYPFCGRLAFSPDGRRIFTGCGTTLSSSGVLADDMVYAGRIALSSADGSTAQRYRAAALAVSPDGSRVAMLEEDPSVCDPRTGQLSSCNTRLGIYDTTTLDRRSLRGLPVHVRGSDRLKQWGRHVMNRGSGEVIIVAEVRTQGESTPTWLLHRVSP